MEAIKTLVKRQQKAAKRRQYYEGTQPVRVEMVNKDYAKWFSDMLKRSRVNLIAPCVDAVAERLDVIGFQPEGVYETFRALGFKALQNQLYREVSVTSEAFILAWKDGVEVRPYLHGAGDMAVEYDRKDPTRVVMAYKLWQEDKTAYLNIYDEHQVLRLQADASSGIPDDFNLWREREESVIRHDFGRVPVVRFAIEQADVDPAIPVQDMLNKSVCDVLVGAEDFALPKRYMTGVGPVGYDAEAEFRSTKPGEYDPRKGATLLPAEAEIGQLPQADITKVAELVDACAKWMAWVTGTPLHYVTMGQGAFPSGEALRTAEARLTSRVTDRQQSFTPRWKEVMALFGVAGEPMWTDAAHVTMQERVELAVMKQRAGVSQEQTWREMGYDEDTIAKMAAENARRQEIAQAAFSSAFDAS